MSLLLSPYTWLGIVLIGLSLLGTGFYYGAKFEKGEQARKDRGDQVQLDIERDKREKLTREIATDFEVRREKVRTVYIKIKDDADENINQNPDYGQCGLDADGLRLYNQRPVEIETVSAASFNNGVP
ncbi:hypothetical protein SAMN05216302_101427 [Nitrosomonas aestuarii]|uniref:Uncharacterized protein n=1 Tax=Nitrosomonas aestuarii TaxID=52441 RepID=A0A1I4BZI0_9PROT|nr:hypothetical protein [Nitrosomonas aestuarii]SFK74202.1 hypothetical protein SAMN05216302_101427 [Nitrosomonas aestuarii]